LWARPGREGTDDAGPSRTPHGYVLRFSVRQPTWPAVLEALRSRCSRFPGPLAVRAGDHLFVGPRTRSVTTHEDIFPTVTSSACCYAVTPISVVLCNRIGNENRHGKFYVCLCLPD